MRLDLCLAGFVPAFFPLATAALATPQVVTRAPKADVAPYSLTVQANVPGASVMEDGLLLGPAGSAFDSRPGVHELLVTAPGYVPRLVRVRLDGRQLQTVWAVSLLPVPTKDTEIELDFAQARTFPATGDVATLPSLCAEAQAAPARLQPGSALPCVRKTVLDDLRAQRYALLEPDTVKPAYSALAASLERASSDLFYWLAEGYYAEAPADPAAASLLAYSAVRRGDCKRVMQLAMEAGAAHVAPGGLGFVRGLCLELTGSRAKAARLYQAAMRSGHATDLAYHAARAGWQADPATADQALALCAKAAPALYACAEAAAQTQLLRGRTAAAQAALAAYWDSSAAAVAEVVSAAGGLAPNRVALAQAQRPWSFELTAARIVTTADEALAARLTATLPGTRIAGQAAVEALLPVLEATGNPALTTVALEALAGRHADDATYLVKLAAHYRGQQRCVESLARASQALRLIPEPERRAALIVSMTGCRLQEGQLEQAEAQLVQVVRAFPESWKASYNLGVVQERLGKPDAALRSFQRALVSDLPDALRARVERTVSGLSGERSRARTDAGAPRPGPDRG